MQHILSDTPTVESSPAPIVVRNPNLPQLPAVWRENFRKRMELGFERKNFSDLQLVMYQLDLADTRLAGTRRYFTAYGKDVYYRHLQNVALHTLSESITTALIKGDYLSIMSHQPDLPEQLLPLDLDDNAPELTSVEKNTKQPVIYTHFHVDESGKTPTANEYLKIIQLMKDYVKIATKVMNGGAVPLHEQTEIDAFDNLMINFGAEPDWGFDVKCLRFIRNTTHIAAANAWIAAMTARINTLPTAEKHQPLVGALTETGWTIEPYVRRHAHWFHDGNRLLAFLDAASRTAWPARKFRMRFVIIIEVLTPDSAYMSEHVVSRLASSYVTCTGMNTTMAGASTTSASSAKGTVFEEAVRVGGQRLFESVESERERVTRHRDNLRVLVTAQNNQRELRGLLRQEQTLRSAADTEQSARDAKLDEMDLPFEE